MTLPFSSFTTDERKIVLVGNSNAVTIPAEFVKSLETLKDRRVSLINLNNIYIIIYSSKFANTTQYDLLQVALTILEALYHSTDDKNVKQQFEKAYKQLQELENIFE